MPLVNGTEFFRRRPTQSTEDESFKALCVKPRRVASDQLGSSQADAWQ
jgi:hypothetical protein